MQMPGETGKSFGNTGELWAARDDLEGSKGSRESRNGAGAARLTGSSGEMNRTSSTNYGTIRWNDRTRSVSKTRATNSALERSKNRKTYALAFGSSSIRDANFAIEKPSPRPQSKYGATNDRFFGSMKVHKSINN